MTVLSETLCKKKFLITRPGRVEMDSILTGKPLDSLESNAGYYNQDGCDKTFDMWAELYLDSMRNSNMILVLEAWKREANYTRHLVPFLHKNKIQIERLYTHPLDQNTYLESVCNLSQDRTVLILSPFVESISFNLPHLDKIHPNYNIKTDNIILYKTPQTIKGCNYPHRNWSETYNHITEEISRINFDVCLLSCGCYGHPLSNFIFSHLNKSAYYVGARLQLCFGIKGKRWEDQQDPVCKMYNKYWKRPFESEAPPSYKDVEDGCYW